MKSIFNVALVALLAGILFVSPAFGQDDGQDVQEAQAVQSGGQEAAAEAQVAEEAAESESAGEPRAEDTQSAPEDGQEPAQESAQSEQPALDDAQAADENVSGGEEAQAAHAADENVPGDEEAQAGQNVDEDGEVEEIGQDVLDVRTIEGDDEQTVLVEEEQEAAQEETEDIAVEEAPAAVRERSRTRLGVLWLESSTGHDRMAHELTRAMIARLDSLGLYEMYYPEDVEKALANARVRVPGDCRDPKCVSDIGRALDLRRVIYGSVDMVGSSYGVRLELFNVMTGRPVETVSIEGAPGVPAKDVLFCAIDRVHGHPGQLNVTQYFGPPINNLKEFLWSTVAVQGTGIFYSLINYGTGGSGSSNGIETASNAYGKETLSGIPGASDQIPLFARPAALANAYTAVSDDAYGVLYNPAGMAWVGQRDAAIAYQYRFGMDLLAVSYANKAMRDLGFGQAILLSTDRDGAMTELFFVTAAGYRINQDYLFGPISVGASIKFMGNTVRALSPDSPRGQSYGFGMDMGFMWELSRDIRYGLMLRDVPSVNKWKNRTTGEQYSEYMPPTMHMGGSYRASHSALLVADGQIPLYADQPWVMAGGIEYEFFRMLALRIGLQREILDEEADWWKITGGAGFKFDTRSTWGRYTILDIAYEYNTLSLFPVVNMSLKIEF